MRCGFEWLRFRDGAFRLVGSGWTQACVYVWHGGRAELSFFDVSTGDRRMLGKPVVLPVRDAFARGRSWADAGRRS